MKQWPQGGSSSPLQFLEKKKILKRLYSHMAREI